MTGVPAGKIAKRDASSFGAIRAQTFPLIVARTSVGGCVGVDVMVGVGVLVGVGVWVGVEVGVGVGVKVEVGVGV